METSASGIVRVDGETELDRRLAAAGGRPVWVFKHSLACGVSAAALEEFERFAGERRDADELFLLLEVQRARGAASALARRTGVRHESPQVILLAGDTVRWHASHWKITAAALRRAAAGMPSRQEVEA